MALDTVVLTGNFISDGNARFIPLRSDLDWMNVYNYTQAGTQQAEGIGVQFYWQRGMLPGTGIEYQKTDSTDALNMLTLAAGGFTLIDSSQQAPLALQALTSISGANPPRVLVGSTAALSSGFVVRIINTAGAQQLGGYEFTIGNLDATHFDLLYMQPIVAAAGPGSYRVIPFDPIFYPVNRSITKMTQAVQMVVTLSVTHGYTVGQALRLVVPAPFGMVQANGLIGNVVAVDLVNNTVTLDIDSTGFSAFTFPLTAAHPFTPAQIVPVGEVANANIANPNLLDDATRNIAQIGILLAGGVDSPAGSAEDLIFWQAGKAFSNNGM